MKLSFDTAIKRLLEQDPKLTSLQAYDYSFEQLAHLFEILKNNHSLKNLSVLDNPNVGLQCGAMIAAMLHSNQYLQTLNLTGSHFSSEIFKDICNALKVNVALEHLDFTRSNIGEIDPALQFLSSALMLNKKLKKLSLYSNNIYSDGFVNLANALSVNSTLITLDLSRNQIADPGMQALAMSLQSNQTIRNLYLVGCDISDAGAQQLALALKQNKNLRTLELWKNQISDIGVEALSQALMHHKNLTSLNLMMNPFAAAGKKALVALADHNRKLKDIRPNPQQIRNN